MVLFFSIAIALQPQSSLLLPRAYSLAGLPAILAFGAFLLMMGKDDSEHSDSQNPLEEDRPRIWVMTLVEWSIFLAIVVWFLVIGFGLSG